MGRAGDNVEGQGAKWKGRGQREGQRIYNIKRRMIPSTSTYSLRVSLSLLMLVVSLIIFFRFRQLRCDRITIHKNLLISYVFTGIFWILYYVLAALDGEVLLDNPLWCQALHIMCQYFIVCNFLWMFCEGLYLNTIMVYAFSSGKILIISCYIIGWGIPVVLTLVYTLVRESDDYLTMEKATRATLILVPLLGLQYLLFPIRPEPGSKLQDVYHTAVALLISLQGAFVSTMYCFCNGEVRSTDGNGENGIVGLGSSDHFFNIWVNKTARSRNQKKPLKEKHRD
ncbi:CALCR-like protein [Mya arenaria]|uniref:CALCR-like protein n=1 Tax=Mya arenaria TaxID=6604 RepID=A0ABY7DBN1_MYAAR|nr:CALCR-like protein [Mya arenaria]